MGTKWDGINANFQRAIDTFANEFSNWKDPDIDYSDLPESIECYRGEALHKKRDELLRTKLGIGDSDFNDNEILWCMRRHFLDFKEQSGNGFGQWWESMKGWINCRENFCHSDSACALGAKRLTKPSEWLQDDVMNVIAIDLAYNQFANAPKLHSDPYELERVLALQLSAGMTSLKHVEAAGVVNKYPESFGELKDFVRHILTHTKFSDLWIDCSEAYLTRILREGHGEIPVRITNGKRMYPACRFAMALNRKFHVTGSKFTLCMTTNAGEEIKSDYDHINDTARKPRPGSIGDDVMDFIEHLTTVRFDWKMKTLKR